MDCVQSSIQVAVDVVYGNLICQNLFHFISILSFWKFKLPQLKLSAYKLVSRLVIPLWQKLNVSLLCHLLQLLLNYVLIVYPDSVSQSVTQQLTASTVRTDLQTDVFTVTNWQTQRKASTNKTGKTVCPTNYSPKCRPLPDGEVLAATSQWSRYFRKTRQTSVGMLSVQNCEMCSSNDVTARLHGASFRATRSMRLGADWGMQRRMRRSCAHG